MIFEEINDLVEKYKNRYKSVSFKTDREDISFKISITKNDIVKNDNALFGIDINIFNNTLDYSIINFGGDIIKHQFYESFDIKIFSNLLENVINDLLK